MIITKTPFRISFAGGGSDLEEFYAHRPGAVLSATINKYMYISSHRFFDEKKIRLKYSKTETVKNPEQLNHPIVRETLKKFNINGAIEISSNADVPAGTGLGSSSSFTVGLLHNLYTVNGEFVSKERLAEEACEIEIDRLREPIGKQDQYAAAIGGLNVFRFNASGTVDVERLHIGKDAYKSLQRNLLMFYTGYKRSASSILEEQKTNMSSATKQDTLARMVGYVDELREVLYSGDLRRFGSILDEGWRLKQQLASKISRSEINDVYELALRHGAVGGKILGAGGGGFLLLYCEPENQAVLRSALSKFRELPFKLENDGSKLIHAADEY